jgi:ornithine cyclodeaminase/alanine dehydrogenase-like protein (mu-crystallin family)
MQVVRAEALDEVLDFPGLIDALANAFRGDYTAPVRHHHVIEREGRSATHLLMPAWTNGDEKFLGTKIVNVFPDNGALGLPAVSGLYVLQSGETGEPLLAMDGARLTQWRTAAASALAARYLARHDARKLLIVGSGALAPFLLRAHCAVRPIETVRVWNHRRGSAQRLVDRLQREGLPVAVADDLEAAARDADVISCATLSNTPLIEGAWLKAGQHLDLVGAFNLAMREADDAALRRARLFVDTKAALEEGGDVAQGLASGAIAAIDIVADLSALCRGAAGRANDDEITLFKSVGAAIEDLAAAILIWSRLKDRAGAAAHQKSLARPLSSQSP